MGEGIVRVVLLAIVTALVCAGFLALSDSPVYPAEPKAPAEWRIDLSNKQWAWLSSVAGADGNPRVFLRTNGPDGKPIIIEVNVYGSQPGPTPPPVPPDPKPVPPNPPGNVKASTTLTDRVSVTWSPSAGSTSYSVHRSPSQDASAAVLVREGTAGLALDHVTAPVGEGWYFVRAVGPGGTSSWSTGAKGVRVSPPLPPAPPLPPTALLAVGSLDKVALSWIPSANATAYEVWRGDREDVSAAAKLLDTSGPAADDTTGKPGAAYWYRVKARGSNGLSGFSAPVSGRRELPGPTGPLRAIILVDPEGQLYLPVGQCSIFTSVPVRQYTQLRFAKETIDGKPWPAFRVVSYKADVSKIPADWQKVHARAVSKAAGKYPFVTITDGTAWYDGPLDANPAAFLDRLVAMGGTLTAADIGKLTLRASRPPPEEIVVNNQTFDAFRRKYIGDGQSVQFGGFTRQLGCQPRRIAFGQAGAPLPAATDWFVPESEWKALITQKDAEKSWLGDLVEQEGGYGVECDDQNGLNYCWAFGPTDAVMAQRCIEGWAWPKLSATSVAGPACGWRNIGGDPNVAIQWLVTHGACPESFLNGKPWSLSPSGWKSGWEASALNYRSAMVRDTLFPDKNQRWNALVSAALKSRPGSAGFMWWSHEVSGPYRLRYRDGTLEVEFENNWGPTFGRRGFFWVGKSKMPDIDQTLLLSVTPFQG